MTQEKKTDLALLLLRLYVGFAMFYGHGLRKMDKLFGGEEITFADPFGLGPAPSLALAVFAEVFCSIFIMLGLFTRLSAIPLIITMLVAWLMVHISDPFGDKELAIFYLVSYIVLFLQGAGWYSLDSLMNRKQ